MGSGTDNVVKDRWFGICGHDSGEGGTGGRETWKNGGGVWEAGEEGAGSGIRKVAGSGRKREKWADGKFYPTPSGVKLLNAS